MTCCSQIILIGKLWGTSLVQHNFKMRVNKEISVLIASICYTLKLLKLSAERNYENNTYIFI